MMIKSDRQPQLTAHPQIYRENITNKSGWAVVIYSYSNKKYDDNELSVRRPPTTSTCFCLKLHQASLISSAYRNTCFYGISSIHI